MRHILLSIGVIISMDIIKYLENFNGQGRKLSKYHWNDYSLCFEQNNNKKSLATTKINKIVNFTPKNWRSAGNFLYFFIPKKVLKS